MAEDLIYGLWRDETFVVLGSAWARVADAELARLRSATTWAEACEAARSMRVVVPPFDPDADDPEDYGVDPDEPLSWEDLPGVESGDFPPMPGHLTRRWLPVDAFDVEALLVVEEVETVFNGSYIYIGPDQEQALAALLRARGHAITRDDAIADRLAWFD